MTLPDTASVVEGDPKVDTYGSDDNLPSDLPECRKNIVVNKKENECDNILI